MKKLVLIGLLMMALLVTVIACSNKNDPPETVPDTTVQENPTQAPIEDSTEEPTDAVEETTVGGADVTDPEETTVEPDDGYPENRLVVDKETYLEGEQIFITAYGGGKDWVGVARVGETEVIRWWYLEKVDGFKNVRSGIKFDITAAEANGDNDTALTAGDYIIYLVADDKKLADNDFIQIAAISIVENPANIETEPETEVVDIESFKGVTGYQDRTGIANFEFYNFAINLGNYDFSKYTGAIIGYGYDGSHWSVAQGFENAPTLAIGFKSTNTSFGLTLMTGGEEDYKVDEANSTVNMEGAIAYAQMEYVAGNMFSAGGQEAVIDLTNVDYNGDVYLTVHNPNAWIEVYYVIFIVDPNYVGSSDPVDPDPTPDSSELPYWTESGIIKHQSFDELDKYAGDTKVAGAFTPGQSAGWDFTINLEDASFDTLRYWGWIAGTGGLGQFGYQINDGERVYNDAWTYPEDMMQHAPAGSDHAMRMAIMIPLTGLDGANTIRVLYKNAAGVEVLLNTITVNVTIPDETEPDEPETNEPETNEPDPDVITEEVDIGSFKGQTGYQGWNEIPTFEIFDWAIDIGEYDLSKYTQVIIGYGYDAVAESIAQGFAAAPSLPIGLKSANTSFGKNGGDLNLDDAIAYGQMVYVGGAENDRRAGNHEVTIDLTDIDYKGNVYLTAYTPDAWIDVYYVIFVVDPNYTEPSDPETPVEPAEDYVVDLSALNGADGAEWAGSPLPASWQDEGNGNWKLFINRFVSLGNLNLANYSKVKITYGFDASVNDAYAGTKVGLLSGKDLAATWAGADGEGVFGSTALIAVTDNYAAGKQTVEIDLSTIAYDGEVYVCFVAGGISIYSIEFVA